MRTEPQADPLITCELCGRFGALDMGGKHVCADCYEDRASCCLEFGGDDLWLPEPQSDTTTKPFGTDSQLKHHEKK